MSSDNVLTIMEQQTAVAAGRDEAGPAPGVDTNTLLQALVDIKNKLNAILQPYVRKEPEAYPRKLTPTEYLISQVSAASSWVEYLRILDSQIFLPEPHNNEVQTVSCHTTGLLIPKSNSLPDEGHLSADPRSGMVFPIQFEYVSETGSIIRSQLIQEETAATLITDITTAVTNEFPLASVESIDSLVKWGMSRCQQATLRDLVLHTADMFLCNRAIASCKDDRGFIGPLICRFRAADRLEGTPALELEFGCLCTVSSKEREQRSSKSFSIVVACKAVFKLAMDPASFVDRVDGLWVTFARAVGEEMAVLPTWCMSERGNSRDAYPMYSESELALAHAIDEATNKPSARWVTVAWQAAHAGNLLNGSLWNAEAAWETYALEDRALCSVLVQRVEHAAKLEIVRPPASTGVWRIRHVSCSPFHTLAVSENGLLFSWGVGADGCLGHDHTEHCPSPRLIEFFGLTNQLRVSAIAAGGGYGACHSIVVATGYLAEETQPSSGAVAGRNVAHLGRVFAWGSGFATGTGQYQNVMAPTLVNSPEMYDVVHGGIVDVSAGDGFTVALTRSGAVFSWGSTANGRLGHDIVTLVSSKPDEEARFLLQPKRVSAGFSLNGVKVHSKRLVRRFAVPSGKEDETICIRSVACGFRHVLAVDISGNLWAWGAGRLGQLGSLAREDVYIPTPVVWRDDGSKKRFLAVHAGNDCSFALSTEGSVFSWGGGEAQPLGHELVSVSLKARGSTQRDWWTVPRKLDSVYMREPGSRIRALVTDDKTAYALTVQNRLLSWSSVAAHGCERLPSYIDFHSSFVNRPVLRIAGRGGRSCFVLGLPVLATPLQRLLTHVSPASPQDTLLYCEDATLPCHSTIIAARSPKLHSMLANEPENTQFSLEVPDVSAQTLVNLLEYMYTDTISEFPPLDSSAFLELQRAAQEYGLVGLVTVCELLINSDIAYWLQLSKHHESEMVLPALRNRGFAQACTAFEQNYDLFADDFTRLLRNPVGADRTIICQRVEIPVHSAVLYAGSEYTKSLAESGGPIVDVKVNLMTLLKILTYLYSGHIVLQEEHESLVDFAKRLGVEYLIPTFENIPNYVGECEELTVLFEWQLYPLLDAHQSRVKLTMTNIYDCLILANTLHLSVLRERCISKLHGILVDTADQEKGAHIRYMAAGQDMAGELLDRACYRAEVTQQLNRYAREASNEEEKEVIKREKKVAEKFPWWAVAVVVSLLGLYQFLKDYNVAQSPFVPVVNVLTLLAALYFAYTLK